MTYCLYCLYCMLWKICTKYSCNFFVLVLITSIWWFIWITYHILQHCYNGLMLVKKKFWMVFAHNLNCKGDSFHFISITSYLITTKCHGSTAFIVYVEFCKDCSIRICNRAKWKFNPIWTRTPAFWDTPRPPMITHTSDSHQIPSQNNTKSKLQILKNCQNFNFLDPTRTVEATELTRDAGRTRDGRGMDGRTDRRTDGVKPIYPPQQLLCVGV